MKTRMGLSHMIACIFFMMFIIGSHALLGGYIGKKVSIGLVLGMSQHVIGGAVKNPCPSNLGILSNGHHKNIAHGNRVRARAPQEKTFPMNV